MRKAQILLFLGIWVAILPFLGFTYEWLDILTTLTGLIFIYFSYILYRNFKATEQKEPKEKTFDNFRENNNFNETEDLTQEKEPDSFQEKIETEKISSI